VLRTFDPCFPIVVSGPGGDPDQGEVLKSYKKPVAEDDRSQKDANGNFNSNPEAEVTQAQLMQVQPRHHVVALKTAKLSLSSSCGPRIRQ